jgi:hypothetical protein
MVVSFAGDVAIFAQISCGVCAIIPDTDTFIEVTKDELENVALESTRTIEIDEFVDRDEIDPRYLIRPYYLIPDGKVGHDAFAVIRAKSTTSHPSRRKKLQESRIARHFMNPTSSINLPGRYVHVMFYKFGKTEPFLLVNRYA